MSEARYLLLRAPEVRKLCEERGLPTVGAKHALVARLVACDDAKQSNGVFDEAAEIALQTAMSPGASSGQPTVTSAQNQTPVAPTTVPDITLVRDLAPGVQVNGADIPEQTGAPATHDKAICLVEPLLIEDSEMEAGQFAKRLATVTLGLHTNGNELSLKKARIGLLRQKLLEHQQRPAAPDAAQGNGVTADPDVPPGLLDKQTPPAKIPRIAVASVPSNVAKSSGSAAAAHADVQSKTSAAPGALSKANAAKTWSKQRPAASFRSHSIGSSESAAASLGKRASTAADRERLKRQLLAKQQELEQKVKRLRQQKVQKETDAQNGKALSAAPAQPQSVDAREREVQQQRRCLEDFDAEWKLERLTLRTQICQETKQQLTEDLSKVRWNRAKAARLAEECRATERQALDRLRRHIVEGQSLRFLSARSQVELQAPPTSAVAAEGEAK